MTPWHLTLPATLAFLDQRRRARDPWIDMAERVTRGQFDKCSNSVLQSLYIGMRRSRELECIRAVAVLKSHKEFSRVPEFVFKPIKK